MKFLIRLTCCCLVFVLLPGFTGCQDNSKTSSVDYSAEEVDSLSEQIKKMDWE